MTDMVKAALICAKLARVIPVEPRGKRPLITDWVNAATQDESRIRHWWQKYPTANIGLALGHGLVALDVDPRNGGNDTLARLEAKYGSLPRTRVHATGGGGQHIFFRAPEGVAVRSGVLGPGVELKAHGFQVVGPGSVHPSGARYRVTTNVAPRPVPAWLRRLGRVRKRTQHDGTPVREGRRNDFLTRIAGGLRRYGLEVDEMQSALAAINQRPCQPPLSSKEVGAIARSVGRYAAGQRASSRARQPLFEKYDLKRMAKEEPGDIAWIVEHFAARGEVTLFDGATGVGKSMVMQSIAVAVALGVSAAGWSTAQGRVLYLDAENSQAVVHRRVYGMGAPPDGIAYYGVRAAHLDLHRNEIADLIRTEDVVLVIVDSLRRLTPGSKENDSDEMLPVMEALDWLARDLDVAVVVIHHQRKDRTDHRGSSVIADQAQLRWTVSREDKDNDRSRRLLENKKNRVEEEQAPRWVRISTGGVEITLKPTVAEIGGPRLISEVQALLDTEGPMTAGRIAVALGRVQNDGAVRRALSRMVDAGQLRKNNKRKYVPVPGPHSRATGTVRATKDASGTQAAPDE